MKRFSPTVIASITFATILLLSIEAVHPDDEDDRDAERLEFALIGDVPYDDEQARKLDNHTEACIEA